MSSAASVATISRYFALLVVRRSATNSSRGGWPSSRNWRTASRRYPASSRSRSRFTSLTERLAQVLPGERLEVEVVVPRPRTQLVQERLVAHHQRAALKGVVTKRQWRVVEHAHVDRARHVDVQMHRKIDRVSEALFARKPNRVEPDRHVNVAVCPACRKRSVEQGEHDLETRIELALQASDGLLAAEIRSGHGPILHRRRSSGRQPSRVLSSLRSRAARARRTIGSRL